MRTILLFTCLALSQLGVLSVTAQQGVIPTFQWERTYDFDTYGSYFVDDHNGGFIGPLTTDSGTAIHRMSPSGDLTKLDAWLSAEEAKWLAYCTPSEHGYIAALPDSTLTSINMTDNSVYKKVIPGFTPHHILARGSEYLVSGMLKSIHWKRVNPGYYVLNEKLEILDSVVFRDILPSEETWVYEFRIEMFSLSNGDLYYKFSDAGAKDTASSIMRLTSDGELVWKKEYFGNQGDRFFADGAVTSDDAIAWISKANKEVTLLTKDMVETKFNLATAYTGRFTAMRMNSTADGILVGGFNRKSVSEKADAQVVYLSNDLALVWDTVYGSPTRDEMPWRITVSGDRYLLTGAQGDNLSGGKFHAVLFTKTTTGIEKQKQGTVKIFPNPARDEFVFQVSTSQPQILIILDSQGRVFKELKVIKESIVDCSSFPCGTYICKTPNVAEVLIIHH